MRVKLISTWFAPGLSVPKADGTKVAGRFYDPAYMPDEGFDVPDELRKFLPSTAVILGDDEVAREPQEDSTEVDALLRARNEEAGMAKAVQAENKEAELQNAKARAARVQKSGGK